jgi:hypothetical protein
MPIYVPGKVVLRQTWQPMDADAAAYITAVETADGQALEEKVKIAIDNFVLGCKADGIWSAIKAGCILAGARTLTGALTPLAGTAPTNFNFVAGDYNRKTGLAGDGTSKYLESNRNNNADSQNNQHLSVYVSTATTSGAGENPMYIGTGTNGIGVSHIGRISSNGGLYTRSQNTTSISATSGSSLGLVAISRSSSAGYFRRQDSATTELTQASQTPATSEIFVFATTGPSRYANARLAFYSIGESLNLALLDARVTDLINAFAAAIP